MAKASYAPMFETVSGALNKINKKSPHAADQKMVLATHRVAATTNPYCSRVYLRGIESISRSTAPTARELATRERFGAVAQAVLARSIDLTKMSADKAAFLAQKDTVGGKKTMKAYLWMVELAAYDQAHQNG